MNELASCREKNSERDVLKISRDKYNLSLPIPLSSINKSPGAKYEGEFCAIALRSWCQSFIDYNLWHVLCGLSSPNEHRERAILKEFWRRFKLWKPDHELWGLVEQRGIDLSKTAPLVLHGDEGRGRKKGPFLVTSYHSYLGKGTSQANASRKHKPYVTMRLNYTGHTCTHRMLTAVLPKMVRDSEAFDDIINFVTEDALDVINNGVVSCHGERFWMATLHIVGDWAWLVKAGNLFRSYSTVQKRPRGEMSNPKGIRHQCFAGMEGVPFEDFRPCAKWKTTLFIEGDEPWSSRPVFLRLPHERKEQKFFAFDIWRSFHLGMGKTFLGSTLALISEQMPGGSVDVRFQHLTSLYWDFCSETHTTSFIQGLTKESLQWPDTKTYPNGIWHKGHVTVTLLQFVAWYFQKFGTAGDEFLQKCSTATTLINEAISSLYHQDLWIENAVARDIGSKGMSFMIAYMELARMAYDLGKAHFIFMPKAHVCNHVWDELATATTPYILNPLAHGVQVDEDMVGRSSRIARRVSPLQAIKRVLERFLLAAFKQYELAGYLKSR